MSPWLLETMEHGPQIANFDHHIGMLVEYKFDADFQNITNNVTLIPRIEYSAKMLSDLIIFLKKEKKDLKISNKLTLNQLDEELKIKTAVELEKKIMFALVTLQNFQKRLTMICGISSIPEILTPGIPILRFVSAQIYQILPSCSHKLSEISVHLGSVILDSAALTRAQFNLAKSNEEAGNILDEVKLIVDSKIRKQYPHLDFLKQSFT